MATQSHYPTYNVMSQKAAWDEHTRSIVIARTVREHGYGFLTPEEAEGLRAACSILADDGRAEIIQYVLCHIDETLTRSLGEGDRKAGLPEARVLLREGLLVMGKVALERFGSYFFMLEEGKQRQMMMELSEDALEPKRLWGTLPQIAFFKKLLSMTVDAYYSHPQVWSEIGYGGPAYPRGYVRADIGHLDPWEAKTER